MSHRRRWTDGDETDFAKLADRFGLEYWPAGARLVAEVREAYPEITRPSRRTGRALRNICFFVWCCCRDGDLELIPTLFHAAVLLSAQDDYYDNSRIPAAEKDSFCAEINQSLGTSSFELCAARSPQLRDLTALWSYVAGTIPRRAPEVRSYWVETACQLNEAMAAENRAIRRAGINYEDYMRTAILSIGVVFIWATYLAHERVPMATLRELAPVLVHGATAVRSSNDIASYRQQKNAENAVTLAGGSSACFRILRTVVEESRLFRQGVGKASVQPHVRDVLLNSLDFLREFYQRYDFDRGPAW